MGRIIAGSHVLEVVTIFFLHCSGCVHGIQNKNLGGKFFSVSGTWKVTYSRSVRYIICSSIGKPNCFWLKIAFLENIYMNMSVDIIPNELVWLRILNGYDEVIVPEHI